jgi:chorismate synthase
MEPFRFVTAGESHGQALTTIIDGVPAGMPLSAGPVDRDLSRRQKGYGRGGRMAIERDRVRILSGVRHGLTLGSPIALLIENRDWANWQTAMAVEPVAEAQAAGKVEGAEELRRRRVTVPRPGHADFVGALKFGHEDLRNVLERASARETAARVAAGAVARQMLEEAGIGIASRVVRIGDAVDESPLTAIGEWAETAESSEVRALDPAAGRAMMAAIDEARTSGDTLGGVFEVVAEGVPPGLGDYTQWDRKLDGRLAQAVMSVHAIKGVEIGLGFGTAAVPGSRVHDEFVLSEGSLARPTNRAGGLEGGVTTGQPVVVRAAMKPIATLRKPLGSVDLASGQPTDAHFERSDVCAVPAAAVVGEAMVAIVLARAFLEAFGSGAWDDVMARYHAYLNRIAPWWKPGRVV